MWGKTIAIVACVSSVTTACGSSSSSPPSSDAADAAETETSAGGCPPGEKLEDDGHCEPAGIPADRCATGFTSDGNRGCKATLPTDACPPGQLAVPGETACHDVAPCASGTWGDIPVEANTQYVDASFTGTSDGSSSAPWKKIGDAMHAANANAIVAIAAGSYAEDLVLGGVLEKKPVRLWGKCPALVEIVGSASYAALTIGTPACNGTEVHDVAIKSGAIGVSVSGSANVLLDGVWIHDTAKRGVNVDSVAGPASVTFRHSLVENAHSFGIAVYAAEVTLDAVALRDTQPLADGSNGTALYVTDDKGARATVTIEGSIVERNRTVGLFFLGSDATIRATEVRDTQVRASDGKEGRGIEVGADAGQRASLSVQGSVVERNHEIGIFSAGSDVTLEDTVVADTLPVSDGTFGRGVSLQNGDGAPTTATLHECLVDHNMEIGVVANGANVTLDGTLVRDTQRAADGTLGRGVDVQADVTTGIRSKAILQSCLVASSFDFGVLVTASDVTANGVLVRDTKPRLDGTFGDGISVFAENGPSTAMLTDCRIEASARAGLSTFGGDVHLATTTFECNAIQLDGEPSSGVAYSFEDLGGNVCGCSGTSIVCQVLDSGLAPPEPVTVGK
jgi:hypothetical protein